MDTDELVHILPRATAIKSNKDTLKTPQIRQNALLESVLQSQHNGEKKIKPRSKRITNKLRKLHTSALTLSVMAVNTNGLNADMRRD